MNGLVTVVLVASFGQILEAVELAVEADRTYDADKFHKVSKFKVPIDPGDRNEASSTYWNHQAQKTLWEKLNEDRIDRKPKNIIFFVADGMSATTITATRMYLGNENVRLSFEEFPHVALTKTYCVDNTVPDSSCTATAFMSGVKTRKGMINVGPGVERSNCDYNRAEHEFKGLFKWAQDAGKLTGVVTTTRITHVTPAAAYSSVADREWEHDGVLLDSGCDPQKYPDSAQQLVHGDVGKKLRVALGGGRANFLPQAALDEESLPGKRRDGRNLIDEWKRVHEGNRTHYVWNKQALKGIDLKNTDYLLGLFDSDHFLYSLQIDERKLGDSKPKLPELVEAAIGVLANKSEDGYVLFVEGGMIDIAHHYSWARLALQETVDFERAIELARSMTSEEDTLIVVTSDHGHAFFFNGNTVRGQDILGVANISEVDGLPYTTLGYAVGDGYFVHHKDPNRTQRVDLNTLNFNPIDFKWPTTFPMISSPHSGEDMIVYASGARGHLFSGVIEQNVLPELIAYAAEIGNYRSKSTSIATGLQLLLLSTILGLVLQ
ncbi:alkaline phosphatase-like [Uranotaenia lowii]|uniref:alkaline phosphatase-like n=1 Tax=Uranotaenia lowii TaxID=190385 RepID=UPI00247978A1|nr:alkaline phosphatase-like [Uranotaenia lowii]